MKYRKKPLVVEAEQFLLDDTPWPKGVYRSGTDKSAPGRAHYHVDTLGEAMPVDPGDWIITESEGGRYACSERLFKLTYEEAEE